MFNIFCKNQIYCKMSYSRQLLQLFICKRTKLQRRVVYIYKHEKKINSHYNRTHGIAVPVTGANAFYGSQWF